MLSSFQEAVLLALVFTLLFLLASPSNAIRSFPTGVARFAEAPQFRNGNGCPAHPLRGGATACDPSDASIALTLDSHYLRGSITAVFSILKHASCPESFFFYFVASADLYRTVHSVFPSLRFKIYPFKEKLVRGLISAFIREALTRNYLAEPCIERVIYLDSDVIVVDDIRRLWDTRLPEPAVIAAPEYCHANFCPSKENDSLLLRHRAPARYEPSPPARPPQNLISKLNSLMCKDIYPRFKMGDLVAEISMEAILHRDPRELFGVDVGGAETGERAEKRLRYEENTSLAMMQLIYG